MKRITLPDDLYAEIQQICGADRQPNDWVREVVARAVRLRRPPQPRSFSRGCCAAVLAVLAERGPLTCGEVERALSRPHQTISARIHDLMRAERIEPRGYRVDAATKRPQTLWGLTMPEPLITAPRRPDNTSANNIVEHVVATPVTPVPVRRRGLLPQLDERVDEQPAWERPAFFTGRRRDTG